MSEKSLAAGDQVEAKCGKCGDVRLHAIVAMVGNEVAKVQCLTCKGVHKYHPAKEEGPVFRAKSAKSTKSAAKGTSSGRASAGSKAAATKAAAAARRDWEEAVASRDESSASAYSMTGTFKEGELISHSTFGLGVVRAIIKPDKMEVMFETGTKLLKCVL